MSGDDGIFHRDFRNLAGALGKLATGGLEKLVGDDDDDDAPDDDAAPPRRVATVSTRPRAPEVIVVHSSAADASCAFCGGGGEIGVQGNDRRWRMVACPDCTPKGGR